MLSMNYTLIFKKEHFSEIQTVFQTYSDKSNIPSDVYENIRKYAPEYTHKIYNDQECLDFLTSTFDDSVVKTFHALKRGAHKADLVRYCLLYTYGGVYLDIKTELVRPLREIFIDKDTFYSVLSCTKDHIYQGIISAPPRHPLFSALIQFMVATGEPSDYHAFCKDMFQRIKAETGSIQSGVNGRKQDYYLFQEKCSSDASQCHDGLDQYGLCCHVWDGDKLIIKTRRSSYPWSDK